MPTKLKNGNYLRNLTLPQVLTSQLKKRKYELPNGKIVDDFYVTTLADSVHIIPITTDRKIVMIRMYKQGVDDFIIQFPAGRYENKHIDILDTAVAELEEETGIKTEKTVLFT
jgi:8-oxo-dGTP pyrophosphatase MutT (NUDIX family)